MFDLNIDDIDVKFGIVRGVLNEIVNLFYYKMVFVGNYCLKVLVVNYFLYV